MRLLLQMIKKELLQVKRDKRMLPIIFIIPIVQLTLLGLAANFDIERMDTAVVDKDMTIESRDFLNSFFGSRYFYRSAQRFNADEMDRVIERGIAEAAIVIPKGFGEKLKKGEKVDVQLFINGSDNNYASSGLNYISNIAAGYGTRVMINRISSKLKTNIPSVSVRTRVWYNPELRTRLYMVPGIMGLLILIITVLLTSMSIVKEKETGTIEQLIVTPVKKRQFILSKLIPFFLLGIIVSFLSVLVIVFGFQIPLRGSILVLGGATLLFLFNTLGLGLLISTISSTQQQAMMASLFIVLLPFIYFSGFVFPVKNMPGIFQYVANTIPLTHYISIVRKLYLKGTPFELMWHSFAIMGATGTVIFISAIAKFRKNL
jgi:ABC-2 type transport system permease protein